MDLSMLNPQQAQAVETTEGPLLILAGAGSGKTKTLTSRIAYLIYEKNISPYHILAITFTNKAAMEMRERIVDLVGFQGEKVWASTFHSTCLRILRYEIEHLDYTKNFTIFDESDQQSLIKQILKEQNLDDKKNPPKGIAARISNFKNELWTPAMAKAHSFGDYANEKAAELYEIYQMRLKANDALDFDDLIMLTVKLFKEHPDVLEKYQDRFQYIFVDEYQDTNTAQYLLIKMLAQKHRNLCVVGDDDQSIYQWRGADIKNILSFEKDYPDAKVIKLEENYRSTQMILDAAYEVIKHNTGRKDKRLWTEKTGGEKISVYTALDEGEEAFFVARHIKQLITKEGRKYSDFAILARATAQFRILEETFIKHGIPYRIFGGTKFYSRKEIKDILAYLKAISNPADTISWARSIGVPKRGIGDTSWNKMMDFAQSNNIPIGLALFEGQEAGITKRAADTMNNFAEQMTEFRVLSSEIPLRGLTEIILEETGYLQSLKDEDTPESQSRMENLEEFLSIVEAFDKNVEPSETSLAQFLSEVALYTDLDNMDDKENAVTIMTMHGAKGLEFPVVFVVGMEENIFPHARALASLEQTEMEEERRLCYVAITRAKEKLFLSRANMRMLYGRTNRNMPSRFLKDIPEYLIEDLSRKTREQHSPYETKVHTIIEPKKIGPAEEFHIGDKVCHRKWGNGIVVGVKGSGNELEYAVAFPEMGIKNLVAKYAPLERK